MRKKSTYHFRKTLRKYRNLQQRLSETTSMPLIRQLSRKLDLLSRRLLRLNRSWKLGIATAALMAWMAGPVQAQVFPANINVDSLDGTNGFVIGGIASTSYDDFSISDAGDINGDGIDDIIIGSVYDEARGREDAGASYVIFGANSFSDSLNLADLNGSNGFVIIGADSLYETGNSVGRAGDVNGDGIDDIIIGANEAGYGNNNFGESYVVFGANTFSDTLDLATLNGSNGFAISGKDPLDFVGRSVSGGGDINGDGKDDIIIGADGVGNFTGAAYVVFGANTFSDSLNVADLNGSNGFKIAGIDFADRSGRAVSGGVDVNGDGLDDILVGARYGDPGGNYDAGESYVIFGANTFSDSLNVADLNGSNGFLIAGIDEDDELGVSLSGAGDVNGDGVDDLLIAAKYGDPNNNYEAGESYVVFGASTFNDSLNLSDLNGSNGFVINGKDTYHYCGFSVSGAGDVNGDGIDDLIIGAPGVSLGGNDYVGESYVIFGATNLPASLDPSTLNGSNGFVISGKGEYNSLGVIVSGAGDVNSDGIADLLIGGFNVGSSTLSAEAYVIFGRDVNASLQALRPSLALEVVPNPTAGTLYLQAEPFGRAARVEIRLYDLMGREVAAPTQQVSSDRYQLDLQALPAGTYLLRAVADGEVGTSRVVKE
jgi:hypothetical protein